MAGLVAELARDELAEVIDRQLNAAVHRIAITQIRLDGLGQAYYPQEEGRRHVQP